MTCIEEQEAREDLPTDLGVVRYSDEVPSVCRYPAFRIGWNWKKALVAAGVGLIVGGLLARETHPQLGVVPVAKNSSEMASTIPPAPELLPMSSTVVEVRVPVSKRDSRVELRNFSDGDVERLKVRNRRLEALVQALRQREENGARTGSEAKD